PRHTLPDRRLSAQTGAEDDVRRSGLDGADQVGQQARVVLVIRVEHDDNARAAAQRLGVAGFLIGAVPEVALVRQDAQTDPPGDSRPVLLARLLPPGLSWPRCPWHTLRHAMNAAEACHPPAAAPRYPLKDDPYSSHSVIARAVRQYVRRIAPRRPMVVDVGC